MNLALGELKREWAVRWVRITDVDGPGTEVSRRVRGGRYAREFDPRHKGLRYRGGATPDCISDPVGKLVLGVQSVQGGGACHAALDVRGALAYACWTTRGFPDTIFWARGLAPATNNSTTCVCG